MKQSDSSTNLLWFACSFLPVEVTYWFKKSIYIYLKSLIISLIGIQCGKCRVNALHFVRLKLQVIHVL